MSGTPPSLTVIPRAFWAMLQTLFKGNGNVLAGLDPTASGLGSLLVAVSAGNGVVNDVAFAYVGGTVLPGLSGADPRYDLIIIASGASAPSIVPGIASNAPVTPALPANALLLGIAYIPAGAVDYSTGGFVADYTTLLALTKVTTKGDILTFSTVPIRKAVGADDTILMADAAQATGLKWVAPGVPVAVGTANAEGASDDFARAAHVHAHEAAHVGHDTIWDTKGDIVAATAADTATKLAVGADGTLLTADSTQATGLKWAAGAAKVDVQVFTANGTWTKPTTGTPKWVDVLVVAAGGGGGGGGGNAAGNHRSPGGGGGGGARIHRRLDPSACGATEPVVVGTGGTSGAGGVTATGANGGVGGDSSFGTAGVGTAFVKSFGGGGGGGGGSPNGGGGGGSASAGATNGAAGGSPRTGTTAVGEGGGDAGTASSAGSPAQDGGGGGAGGDNGTDQLAAGDPGGDSLFGGGGGGAGGEVSSGNVERAGGAGGGSWNGTWATGAGGAAGAVNGGAGTTGGATRSGTGMAGRGGGGGGGQDAGTGGVGGVGQIPGGGAGGGGGGTSTGGAGGVGARGEVIVTTWLL